MNLCSQCVTKVGLKMKIEMNVISMVEQSLMIKGK